MAAISSLHPLDRGPNLRHTGGVPTYQPRQSPRPGTRGRDEPMHDSTVTLDGLTDDDVLTIIAALGARHARHARTATDAAAVTALRTADTLDRVFLAYYGRTSTDPVPAT